MLNFKMVELVIKTLVNTNKGEDSSSNYTAARYTSATKLLSVYFNNILAFHEAGFDLFEVKFPAGQIAANE